MTKDKKYYVEWKGYGGSERFSVIPEDYLTPTILTDFRSRADWPLKAGDEIKVRKGNKATCHRVEWIGGITDIRLNTSPVPPLRLAPEVRALEWDTGIKKVGTRLFRPILLWELIPSEP